MSREKHEKNDASVSDNRHCYFHQRSSVSLKEQLRQSIFSSCYSLPEISLTKKGLCLEFDNAIGFSTFCYLNESYEKELKANPKLESWKFLFTVHEEIQSYLRSNNIVPDLFYGEYQAEIEDSMKITNQQVV